MIIWVDIWIDLWQDSKVYVYHICPTKFSNSRFLNSNISLLRKIRKESFSNFRGTKSYCGGFPRCGQNGNIKAFSGFNKGRLSIGVPMKRLIIFHGNIYWFPALTSCMRWIIGKGCKHMTWCHESIWYDNTIHFWLLLLEFLQQNNTSNITKECVKIPEMGRYSSYRLPSQMTAKIELRKASPEVFLLYKRPLCCPDDLLVCPKTKLSGRRFSYGRLGRSCSHSTSDWDWKENKS